jgi:hypothetical protein
MRGTTVLGADLAEHDGTEIALKYRRLHIQATGFSMCGEVAWIPLTSVAFVLAEW